MKGLRITLCALALALATVLMVGPGQAQDPASRVENAPARGIGLANPALVSTAFTYQGRLRDGTGPVNGLCDFTFWLYDDPGGGSPLGVVPRPGVDVSDGYFTVQLDFGPGAFDGQDRWLEIEADCDGTAITLSPRQELTPAPYALYAGAAPWSGLVDVPPGFADGIDDDTLYTAGTGLTLTVSIFSLEQSYRLPQGCANGQVAKWNGAEWLCQDDDTAPSGDYWSLGGNGGTNPQVNFLGTTDPTSLTLAVDAIPGLRLVPGGYTPNLVGGSAANGVLGGVQGAAIGGGGWEPEPNRVTDHYGTVGGGKGNTAGDGDTDPGSTASATVGGGTGNSASAESATVGGGEGNTASGGAATVGGGLYNTASGGTATIGGGTFNWASAGAATIGGGEYISVTHHAATAAGGSHIAVTGDYATVGGGRDNVAGGAYTTVSGGQSNNASYLYAAIGGGQNNSASNAYTTVGGGWGNSASGLDATVGGGYENEASGDQATVGGGVGNDATGYAATVGGGLGNQATADFATIGGGGRSDVVDPGTANVVSDDYGTVGGGGHNQAGNNDGDPTDAPYATVGGGLWNTASGPQATIGGGGYNRATDAWATVGGGGSSAATGYMSTVGGGGLNEAADDYATVAGGAVNHALGNQSSIGGGGNNWAYGLASTIAGGFYNDAKGEGVTIGGGGGNQVLTATFACVLPPTANYATISGGKDNSVQGIGLNCLQRGIGATIGGGESNSVGEDYATIGGGYDNTADGDSSTIAGGSGNTVDGDAFYASIVGGMENTAIGWAATVLGGSHNTAQGSYSLAAGLRAKANHEGAFVWADSSPDDFASLADDSFSVRSTGGARFVLAIDGSGNPSWTCSVSNGSSWSCSSDRNLKQDLSQADGIVVLEALAQMPIYYWTAIGDDTRHIGPMAQDFAAAFAVGESDTALATIDLDGVALASIQGLYEQSQAQAARIEALEAENAALRAGHVAQQEQLDDLATRLAALEAGDDGASTPHPSSLLFGLVPATGISLLALGFVYQQRRGGGR